LQKSKLVKRKGNSQSTTLKMVIRKIGKRTWRLYSKATHRNLGTFHSLSATKKHEREIEFFKHSSERRYKQK